MEESIVKIENLSHRYTIQWAIRDINFEITRNGIYGLLGSNGAGKSTTMNIMCGVLRPTEGNVYIKGVSIRENPVGETPYRLFAPDAALAPGFDGDGVPGVLRGLASRPGQRDIDGREGGYGQVRYQSFQQAFDP